MGIAASSPMGWTPPNGITMCQDSGVETRYKKEASMDTGSIVGIDIAKNAFHAHGAGADGSVGALFPPVKHGGMFRFSVTVAHGCAFAAME